MFDGGLIVSWIATELGEGVADRDVGDLIRALAERVAKQIGAAPIRELQARPDDAAVWTRVRRQIDESAYYDPGFAQDLAHFQFQIDQRRIISKSASSSPDRLPPLVVEARVIEPRIRALPAGPTRPGPVPPGPAPVGPIPSPGPAPPPGRGKAPSHARGGGSPWYAKALIVLGIVISLVGVVYMVDAIRDVLDHTAHDWGPVPISSRLALKQGFFLIVAGLFPVVIGGLLTTFTRR